MIIAVMLLGGIGCASHVTQEQWQRNVLGFVQDGVTTREQVLMQLGAPTGRFEADRIFTYRIAREGDDGLRILQRQSDGSGYAGGNWQAADFSLVLVFQDEILTRHSLVPVR